MKSSINEAFNWGVRQKKNPRTGGKFFVAYIDTKTSEDTYPFKTQLGALGAKWDAFDKCWYIALPEDPYRRQDYLEKKVKPVIEFLQSQEKEGGVPVDDVLAGIIRQIDNLIDNIETSIVRGNTEEVDTSADPQEIKRRLQNFKEELLASFKDEGWKKKMMPIIKFRKAQGAKFSLLNAILIYIQDPEATMVKSRSNWSRANRNIQKGAPAIMLWRPSGTPLFRTPQEKAIEEKKWLKTVGKTKEQLSVGEKEILMKHLNQFDPTRPIIFKLEPNWFDVRFTEQMSDKEDLIGNPDGEVEWFDSRTPESERTAQLYDAMIEVIQDSNIMLVYGDTSTLGGARGASKSGVIEVLKDSPKDVGSVSTLIHEFSHELLHQRYLSTNDKTGLGSFFIGKEQGRAMVEQQAEISAWIVMRNFGFNMLAARNYVGCWGGSDENCVKVFDTVANVATYIITQLESRLAQPVQESTTLNEGLTGKDVAQMLGGEAEESYERGLAKLQQQRMTEGFYDMLNRMEKSGKDAMTKNMMRF